MSIKRTIITTIVALALVAVVAPAVTQAVTVDELMAQIAALQSQLSGLSGTPGASGSGACAGVTFSRNLTVGATGSDVKCLQSILNRTATTRIAVTGAGSPGNETTTFGPKTLVAVRKYQTAKGFTPANQVGPMTRGALNAEIGTASNNNNNNNNNNNVIPTGTGLTAQFASDNPAAAAVVTSQALAPMAKFVFANGDSVAAKVTTLKLHRLGMSADADLANVYLFQGANRLTDAASVSSGVITFNDSTGLFTVPAGSSATITVYSDLSSSSGETVGIALASATDVTTTASSVKGNFPLNGNLMQAFSGASLGTVVMTYSTSTTPTTNNSLTPAVDTVVFDNSVSIGVRAANLQWLRLREIGSVNYSDLQNFRLFIDGVQKGSAVANLDSNGYLTFDFTSSPVSLQTGTRDVKVLADVIGGSYRNFYFSVRNAADIRVVDSQYGANILSTVSNSSTFPVSTGVQTIAYGAVTVQKTTDSPASNVINTASNQLLGKFTLKATGERVKVDSLKVAAVCSINNGATALRNGALYANGVQIGSTTALKCTGYSTGYTTYNLGSSLIIDPATPVTLEVRADIWDNVNGYTLTTTGIQNNDTIQVELLNPTGNGMGQISSQSVDVPTATVTANSLTIAGGSLSFSKFAAYTDQVFVSPLTQVKLAHFTLTSATTEAVNLNTILVSLTRLETYTTNLYVKYGTQTTSSIATPATSGNNTFTINHQLPAGTTIDVMVYGDVNASKAGNTTGIANVEVKGITTGSSTAVTTTSDSVLAGQTITFSSGAFNATQDSQTPTNQIVSGNQPVTAGIYKFTAQNDSYTINELKFALGAANSTGTAAAAAAVVNVSLKDNSTGTVYATAPVQYLSSKYVAYFTGLTINLPANSYKSLAVVLNLSPGLTADAGTTNIDVQPYMSYIKVANSQGVQTSDSDGSTLFSTKTANKTYVFKSVPTLAYAGTDSSATTGANVELYKFTVGAPTSGPVAVKQMKFTTAMANNNGTGNYLNNFTFFKGTTNITDSVAIVNAGAGSSGTPAAGASLKATNTIGSGTVVVVFTTEEDITAGTTNTYTLKANVNEFTNPSGGNGPDAVSTYMPYDAAVCAQTTSYGGSYLDTSSVSTVYGLSATQSNSGSGTGTYNFIWSDISSGTPVIHSYTNAASSADWYDGYLLQTSNSPTETVRAY
ncbi:MAG: hypothetical protein NT155_01335 [Candidatus Staskawiczbacteria bacterium]|nr:hypothetical protein [Candidatus Staskawiczbacteria bacterium]